MEGKRKKGRSVYVRILIPLLILALLQSGLLIGLMYGNGVFDQLEKNALDMLDERTQNKQQSLQSTMVNWSSLDTTAASVLSIINQHLAANGSTYAAIKTDAALNAAIMEDCAPVLMARLRAGGTTGVFVILDGIGVKDQPNTYAGVYLQDADPTTTASDNNDVLMLRGLPPVSRAMGLGLDSYWKATFTFPDGYDNSYFFKPLEAAKAGASKTARHCAYWSRLFTLDTNCPHMMTYSMPLIAQSGEVLGVIGVDLTENYLTSMLNEGEFVRTTQGCYVLAVTTDNGQTFQTVVEAGSLFKQHFAQDSTTLTAEEYLDDNSIRFTGSRSHKTLYGSMLGLTMYANNTPFIGDQWVLLGLQEGSTLMAASEQFKSLMMVGLATSLVLSLLLALSVGMSIVRPITRLVLQLRRSDPERELNLAPTGINEIDALSGSIMSQNKNVIAAASKLSTIVTLTGLPVGVFELPDMSDTAYCSDGFFRLMDCAALQISENRMPKEACRRLLDDTLTAPVEENVYRAPGEQERYLRIRQLPFRGGTIGTVLDVTEEVANRRRIEHERDYDLLCNILNRRAFEREAITLFEQTPDKLGVAALLMMDLDNLKFLNDTWGHDCGDSYIRGFAEALSAFGTTRCLCARRSGDEFYVLFYGYESRETLSAYIEQCWHQVTGHTVTLPDGSAFRMRASGGIAWYPEDTADFQTLIHYADFAMYKVKQSSKGLLESFDRAAYTEDEYLFSAREALNRMLDQQLLHYAYQPIVSTHTGEVYGYELLMRPDIPELPNPGAVLKLAKAQGLLHHIEYLTWFCGLAGANRMRQEGLLLPEHKIFLNSIANQVIDQTEELQLSAMYGELLGHLVLEVTESEDNNMAYTHRKLAFVRSHGGEIAIDDFGTGYNSEQALMLIDANCIKVDITFVRHVDTDPDKQVLVRNLISYARHRNSAVLAEGVETEAEMRTLIGFGVDYLQGYYTGRPADRPMPTGEALKAQILAMAQDRPADA